MIARIKRRAVSRRKTLRAELQEPDELGERLGPRAIEVEQGPELSAATFSAAHEMPSTTAQAQQEVEEDSESSLEDVTDVVGEEVYKDSSVFLKGTVTKNPQNDYSQHFVDTGQRPQNFVRDDPTNTERYADYPRLRRLVDLKDALLAERTTPPMYIHADLATFQLSSLATEFDVILIEPPLAEYVRHAPSLQPWDWRQITALKIGEIAAKPSFIFIWVGDAEGLDEGRAALQRWGYRRCEDICWIKTNRARHGHHGVEPGAVLQRTKEHCLVGLHGRVKRGVDGHVVHTNIDVDVIVAEEPPPGRVDKPVELFSIIERFCQGRRRLHLFASDATLRPGWVSVGPGISGSNYDATRYKSYFSGPAPRINGETLLEAPTNACTGSTQEIDRLRPKSPTRRG
eukprot:m.65387 g.65387  ORF g.65387 m.65387 type:complete len:400 (+) comp12599_c0_seq2:3-1202(+)